MKKIEGVDLNELYLEASKELLAEKKTSAIRLIKKIAFKIDGLNNEIRKYESGIIKKKAQLDKALALSEKIKSGDWSVLVEQEQQEKQEG